MNILYYLLLILIGYCFSIIFLPSKLKQYSLILSPWIGTVFIIYGGIALGMGRIAMNEELLIRTGFRGIHFLLFIGFLVILYAFIFMKERMILGSILHLLFIGLILVFTLFLDGIPIPQQNQGNIIVQSEYLLNHAITDILDESQKISREELKVGVAMNIAFFQSLLPSNSQNFLSIITRLYLFLYLSLGLIFYDIYKNSRIKFARILLIVYTGFLIYIVMNGITLSGLLSSAIFICSLLFFLSTIDKTPTIYDSIDVVIVLFLFVLFSINPFLALVLTAIFITYYLYKTYSVHSLRYSYKIGIILLLLFLINPLYFGLLFHVYLQ